MPKINRKKIKPKSKCMDSDSENDIPLVELKNNPMKQLHKYSEEKCDICDETFYSSYKMLVHNATHIIIPLLKLGTFECKECSLKFDTKLDLDKHNVSHKPNILESIVNKQPLIVCQYDDVSLIDLTRNGRNVITLGSKINESLNKNGIQQKENLISSKKRIKFEDDLNHLDGINGDVTIVNEDCETIVIVDDDDDDVKIGEEEEVFTESVHYSSLMKPGVYRCRFCGSSFPTRFNLIVHETSHMKARRCHNQLCPICDRYIAGNHFQLKRHMCNHTTSQRYQHWQRCKKCGLKYYNYSKHKRNYHKIYVCRVCWARFENESERGKHYEEHVKGTVQINKPVKKVKDEETLVGTSYLKICETCYLFAKNKTNLHYTAVSDINEIGVRSTCEWCGNIFFELKLIKRVFKRKMYNAKKAPISNEVRLKKMQHRLNDLNKRNKL